jgi:quercetin dioxygenase-like cupin family protein
MVSSFGCPDPTAALTRSAQLAPSRRTQVAHVQCDTAVSVESMLVTGNTKVTDLLCVTPPPIPQGAHSMIQLVELPPADAGLAPHRHSGPVFGYVLQGRILFELEGEAPTEIAAGEAFWEPGGEVVHYQMRNLDAIGWSRFLAVCICAADVDMITMLEPGEIASRDSLRHPSARRYAR